MREIVLDTETTGLDPASGHRLVEIAAVELKDYVPTGDKLHVYLDPQRDVPEDVARIHGLTTAFLSGKPTFADIADDLLRFVGDARLVIHNADFDLRFLNAELLRAGRAVLRTDQALDTLALARRKFPGAANSLDALCVRYRIDASRRVKHSALIDAEILAEVYLELIGGRQAALVLPDEASKAQAAEAPPRPSRPASLTRSIRPEEIAAHREFVSSLSESAIWRQYQETDSASE